MSAPVWDDRFLAGLRSVGDPEVTLALIEEFIGGERPHAESDRLLVTVLFTDIVDSTAQATRLGDRRWGDLLKSYYTMVTRQVDRYRGRFISSTGDGTLSTFDGPTRAVECAVSIRNGAHSLGT